MAERPMGYGMTPVLAGKTDDRYDKNLAAEAMQWIHAITGEEIPGTSQDDVHRFLKNGQVLCKLMNALHPGSIKTINTSSMAFKMMENISHFLTAAEAYGVYKSDLFQTVDLYEKQNMSQVINGIHALGRLAQRNGFNGPTFGLEA